MAPTHTHTYVELEVSEAAYKEIRAKLREADYTHCFEVRDTAADGTGPMDMSGIAVIPVRAEPRPKEQEMTQTFMRRQRLRWLRSQVQYMPDLLRDLYLVALDDLGG